MRLTSAEKRERERERRESVYVRRWMVECMTFCYCCWWKTTFIQFSLVRCQECYHQIKVFSVDATHSSFLFCFSYFVLLHFCVSRYKVVIISAIIFLLSRCLFLFSHRLDNMKSACISCDTPLTSIYNLIAISDIFWCSLSGKKHVTTFFSANKYFTYGWRFDLIWFSVHFVFRQNRSSPHTHTQIRKHFDWTLLSLYYLYNFNDKPIGTSTHSNSQSIFSLFVNGCIVFALYICFVLFFRKVSHTKIN